MSGMRLVCLGCGDAFSARWYSSCLAVEAENCWMLIDCPHPIRKILREAGVAANLRLDVDTFSAAILTHLHADHSSGIEGWAYYHKYVLESRPTLIAHPDVWAPLWQARLAGSVNSDGSATLSDYFDMRALDESNAVEFGPFQIECRRTLHPIPTFALRIRATGRTLGCSADTAFDPGLIEWLSEADLIIHETNYGIHTPYEKLAALPEALRSRMRLIHYPDDFDVNGSNIAALQQGEICAV